MANESMKTGADLLIDALQKMDCKIFMGSLGFQ